MRFNRITLTSTRQQVTCNLRSHTRTVVRECFKGDERSQWKRPKFDPSPHQNPFTDFHKNWQVWLRPGWHLVYTGMQNFAIDSGVSAPQIRNFAELLGWLVFSSFVGFFNKATAYTLERIFTQNTSKDVGSGKEVYFGGPDNLGTRWHYGDVLQSNSTFLFLPF